MHGKTAIVTGATNGIGKVTALELARKGARVIVVGRNPVRVTGTVDEIKAATGQNQVSGEVADLTLMAAVRDLANRITANYPRIDVLINNAGALFPQRQLTTEGLEMTFALNHMSYFLLTNLLLDAIIGSAPARIINVSSDMHMQSAVDLDNLQAEGFYNPVGHYGRTKGMNILFTRELAWRLATRGVNVDQVTVNTLHPGMVDSNFFQSKSGLITQMIMGGITLFGRLSGRMVSPEQGAQTSIYLASSPEVAGVTGRYFVNCHEEPVSAACQDAATARRLWEISERMADLSSVEARAANRGAPVVT
jgi:NAD(P)-dependent dehydrogenase (short-subunit alcohol dehydrogenase family)